MRNVLSLIILVLLSLNAYGQPFVPAEVESVTSGGYWIKNNEYGRYRVIVSNSGFEHISSNVFIQWISDPKSPNKHHKIIATKEIVVTPQNAPISISVNIESIKENQLMIYLSGINTVTLEGVKMHLIAGLPNHVEYMPNKAN